MNELTIELTDRGVSRCLYQQIYEHIRDEIKQGKLLEGEKLPSSRFLAEYLQVARSTVDSAYGQLVAEGYVEARPCKGYFVSRVEELFQFSREWEQTSSKGDSVADSFGGRHTDKGLEERRKEQPNEDDEGRKEILYDFSPHAVSLKDFPYATWKKITKNILVDANSEMFALGDARGDEQLRETISRYLHSSRGVNCTPGQIVVGAGTDYLFMLLEKILGKNVSVAMENPTYKRAYRIFCSFSYEIKEIPMDGNGMNVEELRGTNAKIAYVMPSHQYPTGVVMPIGRRLELLKWAEEEEGRYLIEDDYDSEFRYKGKPIPSLQASDRNGRVIYMGTFSKSIAPAIRVGYMVLPLKLLQIYRENCGFYASTVSRIDQRILNEFIRDGYFERYLNKMRKIYKGRHDFLLDQLIPFEKEFVISGENAGLHLLLTSCSQIPEQELIKAAQEEGIKLYGISDACMGKGPEGRDCKEKGKIYYDKGCLNDRYFNHTVLLGYGALEEQELGQGMELLKKAWNPFLT